MKKVIVYLLIFGMLLSSCGQYIASGEDELNQNKKIQNINDIPNFPFLVIHIVQREYIYQYVEQIQNTHSNEINKKIFADNIEEGIPTFDEYLEDRLIQLFPDDAYLGMVADIRSLTDDMLIEYEATEGKINDPFENEYEPMTTLEKEIEYINMNQEEIDFYTQLEELATQDEPLTLEEIEISLDPLFKQNASTGIFTGLLIGSGVIALIAAVIGYSYLRARQCESRAYTKTEEYFGIIQSGEKGDAFKHIYVSMLLRRYLTRTGSYLIMGYHEKENENSFYGDTAMDYHNNSVGRIGQYSSFRGAYFGDMYNWEGWAENVNNYINNSSNGVKFSWSKETTSLTPDIIIDEDLMDIPNTKYVYYLGE